MWQALDVQRAYDMIDCLIQRYFAYQRSLLCQWCGMEGRWPNGLALSCAARIDRDDTRAETNFQNGYDLRAAKRRQIQRRVGPPLRRALDREAVNSYVENLTLTVC
jgi:hypothetical protein